jgi:hypothetical protein
MYQLFRLPQRLNLLLRRELQLNCCNNADRHRHQTQHQNHFFDPRRHQLYKQLKQKLRQKEQSKSQNQLLL